MEYEEAEAFLREGEFRYVRFEQTDLHGLSRSKTVPVRHFRRFAESGLNFFGGLLALDPQSGVPSGTGYMDERNFADQLLRPDRRTLAPVPWVADTARVIGEPHWYDAGPAAAGPRYLLGQMLRRLDDLGYIVQSGFEYEFYLAESHSRQPVFDGIQIFWTLRNYFDPDFMAYLLDSLTEAGIDVITSNAEYGPGQMEINFAPVLGVTAADLAFTFKNGVKEMAQQEGYLATFMTKPYGDQSASGCHYHHSLLRKRSQENAFYEDGGQHGLSQLALNWIGGQITHARALAALLSPTVNCAKRYRLFSFAPVNATWGLEDRTAAIRIKGGRGSDTHIENRMPGAASNPYLVAAAILAAGIDGIEKGIQPPVPNQQMAYLDEAAPRLPQTLDESLEALEQDRDLQQYLGEEFLQLFVAVKRFEIAKAREALPEYESAEWPTIVTQWERENLFEYL